MILKDLLFNLETTLINYNQNKNIAFYIIQHYEHILDKLDFINKQNNVVHNVNECIKAVDDYINGKPLDKILGYTYFLNHKFIVNNNVFSPRNDTEFVVDFAIKKILSNKQQSLNLADVCCGTGIIGISIKKQIPNINLYQSDIDENAYFNTIENAKLNNVTSNVILSPNLEYYYKKNIILDVIISNPPYISFNDINVGENVDKYDPIHALYCGDNGLMVYKSILNQAKKVLNQHSYLMIFEIGFDQGLILSEISKSMFNDANVDILKDLNNKDRILIISKNW